MRWLYLLAGVTLYVPVTLAWFFACSYRFGTPDPLASRAAR